MLYVRLFVSILVVAGLLSALLVIPSRRSPATRVDAGPDSGAAQTMTRFPMIAEPDSLDVDAAADAATVGDPMSEIACGPDMVLIEGEFCADLDFRCGSEAPKACSRHATPKCVGGVSALRFCIDTRPYPNLRGMRQVVMVTHSEASAACAGEQKRLCRDAEWTLACEGPARLPSPCGWPSERCPLPTRPLEPDRQRLWEASTTAAEVLRVDDRRAIVGASSAAGVLGLASGTREWVTSDRVGEYDAALKGQPFDPRRGGCRPSQQSKMHHFRLPDVGFRCCRSPHIPRPPAERPPRDNDAP